MKIAVCAGPEDAMTLRRMILKRVEEDVELFSCREDLLYRMQEARYDVVIVALPGALGMETAAGARRFCPDTALIWASDEVAFIAESYRLRADMFLSLPLEEAQVNEALERAGIFPAGAEG